MNKLFCIECGAEENIDIINVTWHYHCSCPYRLDNKFTYIIGTEKFQKGHILKCYMLCTRHRDRITEPTYHPNSID